jgi:hypothetical protein
MGGGPTEGSDRVLCMLAWPESRLTSSLAKLRAEFPDVEFTYHQLSLTGELSNVALKKYIPVHTHRIMASCTPDCP